MRRGRWALLAAAWAAGAHAFLGLPQKRFKEDALIDAGALGLDALHGHIAAWSYADADRYVDAVVVDADRQEARVHRWEHAAFRFASEPMASVRVPDTLRIANVVPADLTYDGRADLLVMAEPRTPSAAEPLTLLLYAQQANGTYGAPQTLPPAMAPQPLLVDASGTLQGDLLGHAAHDPSRLVLWRRDADTGAYTLEDLVMHGDVPPCTLGHPHSSAHVDLDGDCLADLFLVCANHAYQIWTARADEPRTYDLARAGDLPPGAGPLAFADMNRDGTMDVVFATCDRQRCDLVIAYNEQMPLCEREKRGMLSWPNMTAPARCRDEMQMCTRDVQFRLDLSEDSELLARLPLDALTGDAALLQYDEIGTLTRPVGVRVGDYNRDGYPDVALLTVPARAPPGRTRVHLLESTPCVRRGAPGCADAPVARRSFQRLGGTVLDALEYVRHIAFLDLDEDGTLDLVLQSLPPLAARTTDARAVSFVQNNYFHDAFFLRAVTLNAACGRRCEPADARPFAPWGGALGGASYKFSVLDPNGVRRAQQGTSRALPHPVAQQPQTGYGVMLPPMAFVGLGRTNNYIESLFVGSTRRGAAPLVLEGVIPNSQVVLSPSGPAPDAWRKELFLHPADWIPLVTLTLCGLITLLGGIVWMLDAREKREDERERQRAVHAINFDAL